jgi:thioredoxin reductase
MFDVLIIGGGVSGISCALVLGSAKDKNFAADKEVGVFTHQKIIITTGSCFNNWNSAGSLGSDLLVQSTKHLSQLYPNIAQISKEKILRIEGQLRLHVTTNKKHV